MKLSRYLDEQKISGAEFARRIGVESRMTVLRYASGERIPRPDVMRRIAEETAGAVSPNDFFDAPEPAHQGRKPGRAA